MELYKFKSLSGEGLFYALDMIINERIYLSTRDNMNDINEGQWNNQFRITGPQNKGNLATIEKFKELIDSQRFTCFVKNIENQLMWAHYADGFSGIALQFDLDDREFDLREVDYIGIPDISIEEAEKVISGNVKPQDIGVLKRKDECWHYEKEWRLFSEETYLNKVKPTQIILGAKKTKHHSMLETISGKFELPISYMVPKSNSEFCIDGEL